MNGNKFFLDTNAIIALLSGNTSIEKELSGADWIGVSVISVLEFMSFPGLSFNDNLLFVAFLKRIEVIGIHGDDLVFLEALAGFKSENKLKLPDAIIAGYAIQNQAILISNDKHFESIKKLSLQKF